MKRLALLGLCLAACSDPSLTEILVVVDSDIIPELETVTFDVVSPDGTSLSVPAAVDQFPMSLALVHRGGALGPLSITVTGTGGETIVQRRARVSFVAGEVRVLQMNLLRSCVAAPPCGEEETCEAGMCRSVDVRREELGTWDGTLPGLGDAGPGSDADMGDAGMDSSDGGVDAGPDGGGDACVVAAETCNGMDDDCDGSTDEDFEFETDMLNCGVCGRECPVDPANAGSSCAMGECQLDCDTGYDDCDAILSTGCESNLDDPATCGDCMNPCRESTPICDAGFCEAACTETQCSGACVDTDSSVANCGSCGFTCTAPDAAVPVCTGATCSFRCDVDRFNCDGLMANGCESRRRELDHCGACGTRCGFPRAVASCVTGTCELVGCESGRGDCDLVSANGCETNLQSDVLNCGTCDRACPYRESNSTATCTEGTCGLVCDDGRRDCDGDPTNGCEVSLSANSDCGACGNACGSATPVCEGNSTSGWSCVSDCAMTECGAECVDLTRSVDHCGACGRSCGTPAHGMPLCSASECQVICDAGFADCNGSYLDGCETPLGTTSACSTCAACVAPPNATATCADFTCGLGSCAPGYRDCNMSAGDGCETSITTPSNCGSCGTVCGVVPHASVRSCTGASCTIDTCDAGWNDCDGSYDSGCESNRLTDKNNCGGCGIRCTGGGSNKCCDGVCGSC